MKKYRSSLISLLMFMIITIAVNPALAQDPEQWEEQDTILVGRISHIEGQLSRYHPETDDWQATTMEAPFGTNDLLHSEPDSKAEFIMPNNTWIRIDGDTRIQLLTLLGDITEVDLAFGRARFYNKSVSTQIKAITPFGHISAPPGAAFDLYVQENGVEINAIKKSVSFTHNASSKSHDIRSGSSAIFADMHEVTAVPGEVEYAWQKWNQKMDALWAERMRTKGESAVYLPPELHSETYYLDRYGVWERVYYDGAYYRFWRPVQVYAGWAPFTSGAWIVWHGDHVWVPHDPFGYVTHHYGNWVFASGHWYWAPPVTRITLHAHYPLLKIGFGWYPGRVAWIHFGAHLGWIPLAPYEPYYTHHHWGRRSIVVAKGRRYHHQPHKFKHHHHAVVIHRSHLYRSSNYRHARVRNIPHSAIQKNFRTTPVLNASVTKNYRPIVNKDRFRPSHQTRKPNYGSGYTDHKYESLNSAAHRRHHGPSENRQLRPQKSRPESVNTQRDRNQKFKEKSNITPTKRYESHRSHKAAERQTSHKNENNLKVQPSRKTRYPTNGEKGIKNRNFREKKSDKVIKPSQPLIKRPRYQRAPNGQQPSTTAKVPSNINRLTTRRNNTLTKAERGISMDRPHRSQPVYRSPNHPNRVGSENRFSTSGGWHRNRN